MSVVLPTENDPASPVVFLLPAFPEQARTGGEIYNHRLIEGLRDRGRDVRVIAVDALMESRPLHEPGVGRVARRAIHACFDALLQEISPDAGKPVLIYDSWLYRFLWNTMPAERLRKRFRLISFSQLCYWDTYRGLPHRLLHRAMTLAALASAHHHIAVSRSLLRADLGVLGRTATTSVIYPGCDYAGLETPRADCARMPAEILSVGNYAPRKGFHILIEAMDIVFRRCPELRGRLSLRLVGNRAFDTDYLARLERMIEAFGLSDSVVLDDWKRRDDLSALFSGAQIFAFASESEGFGMVALEAMFHGLPALLGDFMTANELVGAEGECGYVVNRRSPQSFAMALVDFFTRRDRPAMGCAAHDRARSLSQNWDGVVDRFEEIIFQEQRA